MPRRSRKETVDVLRPLITFERVVYQRESFRLSQTTLANIKEYATYVGEFSGDRPSHDEVIDKGMQRLFAADKGFQQWLSSRESGSSAERVVSAQPLRGDANGKGGEGV
jgi:hypothetical protein